MPRSVIFVLLALVALSLVPLAFLARARTTLSKRPRIQVVYDMDNQPKLRAQASHEFFADKRAMRLPVKGTVARGELAVDDRLHRGQIDADWVTMLPVPLTAELMARGRDRFEIFCTACHGLTGRGDGMVSQRASELGEPSWTPPSDLTSDLVADRPAGHLYNTITHGIRNMPAYGPQIPVEDRWAIVAYVRALQRSVRGTLDDVPEEHRATLQ